MMPSEPALTTSQQAPLWHALSVSKSLDRIGTTIDRGLSRSEADDRLSRFGPNRIREEPREPVWKTFVEHVREPMLLLLFGVGVLYLIFGRPIDAFVVWAIVLAIVGIEIVNERRAATAIAALHAIAEPQALVRREGTAAEVVASEVAPGDAILLEAGRRVAADARLVESHSLLLDESVLTGESAGVEKEADLVLRDDTPLAERRNLVFAGTSVLRGRGAAVVFATGPRTELGRIAELTVQAEESPTPLQQALRQIAGWMVWVAAAFSIAIPLIGWVTGQPLRDMFLTGFALFFASVPEELPVIITLVLAFGSFWLSRQRAIVRRQRAVERLAGVTVIATDKTGTLTENRMVAKSFWPPEHTEALLKAAIICNDAANDGAAAIGDPLDRALVEAAKSRGLDVAAIRIAHPLVDEYSFDGLRKRMSVTTKSGAHLKVAVKGAPESVVDVCTTALTAGVPTPLTVEQRQAILEEVSAMAADGLRVIAVAEKESDASSLGQEEAESGLTFLGLVGMEDPLRPEAREAIVVCQNAGIRTVIVSGDHPQTVQAIARQLGLPTNEGVLTGKELAAMDAPSFEEAIRHTSVFARTTPEQKLQIVRTLTRQDQRVAVTGDGINDAPALAAAEVGIAMGRSGTDVARQAADVVLMDDSFGTLERSIRQCRALFANLEKGIRYYLACKVALVTSSLVAVLLGAPVPFLPVQIILMELIMDLAASAGFVAEPAERNVMRRPPRDAQARVLDRRMILGMFSAAIGLFAAVTVAYLVGCYGTGDAARAHTVAFVTWLLGHVLMAFTLRSSEPLARIGLLTNRVIAGWAFAVFVLLLLIAMVPFVRTVTLTVPLSAQDWLLVIGAAAVGTLWCEVAKQLRKRAAGAEELGA